MKREDIEQLLHPEFPDRWTVADANAGDADGWNIYQAHGGLEIERNDINHPPHEDVPEFESDDKAIEFVKAKAAEDSERHQRALAIHEKYAAKIQGVALSA